MLVLVVLAPIALGLIALATPAARVRPWLVTIGAGLHRLCTAIILVGNFDQPMLGGWLATGPLARPLLGYLSVQFFLCSLYVPGYLALRRERPNRVFCAALLVLIGTMTLVILAHHLGLMWVAIESSTLA